MAFSPGRIRPSLPPFLALPRGRALLSLVLLLGCSPGGEPADRLREKSGEEPQPAKAEATFPLQLLDASGREVTFQTPPERIVCLIPSASQVFLALGVGHRIVGRTDQDTASALAHLPSIGEGLFPNLEALLVLDPDLVIRFAGESDPDTPRRLDDFGIPHFAVRPDRLEEIRDAIRNLGILADRSGQADSILMAMDATLQEIRDRVGGRPRVPTAYLLGGDPPWVAGAESYLHQLLELAGGENVFADLKMAYGPVSREAFLVRDMEMVLTPRGADPRLPELAVPIRQVPPSLEVPGPFLARDALRLARILHPEAFH